MCYYNRTINNIDLLLLFPEHSQGSFSSNSRYLKIELGKVFETLTMLSLDCRAEIMEYESGLQ